jgi:transposase
MWYEFSDYEWGVIKPMLPNKPRGIPRVDDRRVLNGIFWVLRSGAPWRDLPESYGPPTTCYNRFVRWRQAGVWDRIMNALSTAHDAAVQMIDTSVVRVHQHGVSIAGGAKQHMGRSRGGLTSKIHAVVDANGLPVHLGLTRGEAHNNRLCPVLLSGLRPRTMLLTDRGYDADWIRAFVGQQGAWANIPPKRNRKEAICFSPYLYRARNLVERFFNNNVAASPRATTSSQSTIWASSNLRPSAFGYVLMSPRPRLLIDPRIRRLNPYRIKENSPGFVA